MTDTKMSFKDALIAHLQGEAVEVRGAEMDVPWKDFMTYHGQCYLAQINETDFGGACEYRIKPRTVMCNGVEVPAPESVAPESMTQVFAPSTFSIDLYSSWCWHNDRVDDVYLERGLVYLNQEDAIARAKAMLITK